MKGTTELRVSASSSFLVSFDGSRPVGYAIGLCGGRGGRLQTKSGFDQTGHI